MSAENISSDSPRTPEVFIISGGLGASAVQVINTVLAQFPNQTVNLHTIANVRQPIQISEALARARSAGGIVIHTLVNDALRSQLVRESRAMGVPQIDLMGDLITWLANTLGTKPLQEPGRYRQIHSQYFDRVAAIDYMLKHDDGMHPEGWAEAEVLIVGPSRTGKTPLCAYLAVLGWKAANYPLVPGIPVPPILQELNPARVIGLTLDAEQLLLYRRQRQYHLGVSGTTAYVDVEMIEQELQEAMRTFRLSGFQVVNMTDKTIEQGADEIIRKMG